MKSFELTILASDKTLFKGLVTSVSLPGAQGRIGILPDHALLIASLKEGEINIAGEEKATFSISSGFLNVDHNKVTVVVC